MTKKQIIDLYFEGDPKHLNRLIMYQLYLAGIDTSKPNLKILDIYRKESEFFLITSAGSCILDLVICKFNFKGEIYKLTIIPDGFGRKFHLSKEKTK